MLDIHTLTAIPRATQAATLPESLTGDLLVGQSDVRRNRLAAERAIDEVLAESFPASDPPPWTLGIVRPNPVVRVAGDGALGAIVVKAEQSASAAGGVLDASRPTGGERTVIEALISLAAVCGIVLLVPFVILLVGLPIALLVRGFIEAVSWLLALIIP